ncbi:hypothetical protein AB0425_16885 [Actinosynnema sp. NPDC051121]
MASSDDLVPSTTDEILQIWRDDLTRRYPNLSPALQMKAEQEFKIWFKQSVDSGQILGFLDLQSGAESGFNFFNVSKVLRGIDQKGGR